MSDAELARLFGQGAAVVREAQLAEPRRAAALAPARAMNWNGEVVPYLHPGGLGAGARRLRGKQTLVPNCLLPPILGSLQDESILSERKLQRNSTDQVGAT